MSPDRANSTPMVITMPVTVLSGYLMSNTPTAMAVRARKKELCRIFMMMFFYDDGSFLLKS